MIDVDFVVATVELSIPFDHLPPRLRNPDPGDLDRLAASFDGLTLCCCKPEPDEADKHLPPEAVATDKQFLVDTLQTAGE